MRALLLLLLLLLIVGYHIELAPRVAPSTAAAEASAIKSLSKEASVFVNGHNNKNNNNNDSRKNNTNKQQGQKQQNEREIGAKRAYTWVCVQANSHTSSTQTHSFCSFFCCCCCCFVCVGQFGFAQTVCVRLILLSLFLSAPKLAQKQKQFQWPRTNHNSCQQIPSHEV